jgi:hypothetical protein
MRSIASEERSPSRVRPWANEDVSAFGLLLAQLLDGLFDLAGALPFSQDHLAGTFDADIGPLAAHRAKLYAHQPLDDRRGFLAALLGVAAASV